MSQYSESQLNYNNKNSSWYKTFNLIPEDSTVMDIGCSSGNFGEQLIEQKNCVVDGIEINEGDIKKASQKLRKVYKLDVETDEIDIETKYDVIFMGDVVEHLARPVPALKKIKELLKPDGILVFSIPNITHMSVRLMLLEGRIEYGKTGLLDETHLHFYNQEEIYRVFEEAGLTVDHIDAVEKDIPTEFLEKELRRLGLKMLSEFKDIARSVNGATYQFVGRASVSPKKTSSELPIKSPIDRVEKSLEAIKKNFSKEIRQLRRSLSAEIKARKQLEVDLNQVRNSTTFKVGRLIMRWPIELKQMLQGGNRKSLTKALDNYYKTSDKSDINVAIITRNGDISPTSSTFLRLVSPLTCGKTGEKLSIELLSGKVTEVDQDVDVCIIQRTAIDSIENAELLIDDLAEKDIKLIVDTDDNFVGLERSHPQFNIQNRLADTLDFIKKAADRVWVSTDGLAVDYKNKRAIHRNSVDGRLWKLQQRPILEREKIKFLYMGTATHDEDFKLVLPALKKLNKKYPDSFELYVMGVATRLPDENWLHNVTPEVKDRMYPYFVEWFQRQGPFDVGLAPLVNSEFNRAKSDIKVLDYLCVGILPVVSDIEPYQNEELEDLIIRVGYNDDDWLKALEDIVNNKPKYAQRKQRNQTKIKELIEDHRSVKHVSQAMLKEINKLVGDETKTA